MPSSNRQRTIHRRGARGQSLLIIAASLIALALFVGLVVDTGALFIAQAHLRRAVDAAALAAAGQVREGRTLNDIRITDAALEYLRLNGLDPDAAEVKVDTCATADLPGCPPPGDYQRKLVRVTASIKVSFSFLPLIGIRETTIVADAVTEAASIDLVLVIDRSESMTNDIEGDTADVCNQRDADGAADGVKGDCHPFQEVKKAAMDFAERMNYPYDRVAVVSFDQYPHVVLPFSADKNTVVNAINSLTVLTFTELLAGGCVTDRYNINFSKCPSTSIGDGLLAAAQQFGASPRQEALWVTILLTDGAANGPYTYCPRYGLNGEHVQPYCRDSDVPVITRHGGVAATAGTDPDYDIEHYDADDWAKDKADFLGCLNLNQYPYGPTHFCSKDHHGPDWEGGQGSLIFAIGLGRLVTSADPIRSCDQTRWPAGCRVDAGEQLLRYIAAVGDDGNPETDPCAGKGVGVSCGNYYYAATGASLQGVFESIASRIFTRLTH